MTVKKTLTGILTGATLVTAAGLCADAMAQEIVTPPVEPAKVQRPLEEEKQEKEKKEKKEEKKEKKKASAGDFDFYDSETKATPSESKDEESYLRSGRLQLNAFNSDDLDSLSASAKVVFADDKYGSRLNLYSLFSNMTSKGDEGVEDLNTKFQLHGVGLGNYIKTHVNLDRVILYPEFQVLFEQADHKSESGQVDFTASNFLIGGKLGYSNRTTKTKLLAQILYGKGSAEGQISDTVPYDENIERFRAGLSFKQKLTPHLLGDESGLSLKLDAIFDKTNYKKLQKDSTVSLSLETPYVVQFSKDKKLTVTPFLTWREEQTEYNTGNRERDRYFGGGLALSYKVGNFELYLIPGYDEEHKATVSGGIVIYFGSGKRKSTQK